MVFYLLFQTSENSSGLKQNIYFGFNGARSSSRLMVKRFEKPVRRTMTRSSFQSSLTCRRNTYTHLAYIQAHQKATIWSINSIWILPKQRSSETMEEIISLLIQQGCKLARELESNLPNLADKPNMLSKSCEEIINAFRSAKERLHSSQEAHDPHMIFRQLQQAETQIETSLQGWKRPSTAYSTQPIMDMLQMQLQADRSPFNMRAGSGSSSDSLFAAGRELEGSARSRSIGGEFQSMDASDSGIVSSSQRQRRRWEI